MTRPAGPSIDEGRSHSASHEAPHGAGPNASVDVDSILGHYRDPGLVETLHRLEHDGAVETVTIPTADLARRRLRAIGDLGTEYRIALPRDRPLFDGAVLALLPDRAAILRVEAERWLRLKAPSVAAGLELGYSAGNLHWRVRFEAGDLLVALEGPVEVYLARIEPLLLRGVIATPEGPAE